MACFTKKIIDDNQITTFFHYLCTVITKFAYTSALLVHTYHNNC